MLAVAVFLASIVADVMWGFYIRRVSEGKALAAANYALCIMLIGAANIVSFTEHHWLALPIAAGNWVGTYGVVRWDRRRRDG